MGKDLEKRIWWTYIHEDLRELLNQSYLLIDFIDKSIEPEFHDYAFIVFPAAKSYEGFLKTLFHDLGFISDEDFNGKRFRIGKALNPSLDKRLRKKEGVYDQLVSFCQGPELADALWDVWKRSRNLLFHWFPKERNAISFEEARLRVEKVLDAMDLAFKECKIERARE